MATATEKRKYTYEDYLNTPDDKRYELIEGELLMTPSPVPYHQWVAKNFVYDLERFVRQNKAGKVFGAPCDVLLNNENVLEPDVLFISTERLSIIGEKNIQGAPDLIVEVLSESTAYRDLVKKKRLYAEFAVKEYWIVDPNERTVDVYRLSRKDFVQAKRYSENDILESPLLPGLKISLTEVFAY